MQRRWLMAGLATSLLALLGCGGGGGGATDGNALVPATDLARATADTTVTEATGALQGRILDEAGQAVAGAEVTITVSPASRAVASFTVLTDADGWFRIGNLPPGDYEITVRKDGLQPVVFPQAVRANRVVRCDDVEAPVDPAAPGAGLGKIKGTVKNTNGQPLSGARVVAIGQGVEVDATTNEEGRYVIEGLAPGAYRLVATKTGYQRAVVEELLVEANSTRLHNFVLSPETAEAGQIRGVVKSAAGAPLSSALVRLLAGGLERETRSNADGVFEFGRLSPGEYALVVSREGYRSAEAHVTVLSGQTTATEFFLEPVAAATGRIVGLVQGAGGAALVGARVVAEGGDLRREAVAGPGGSFEIVDLPAGRYTVTASKEGFASATATDVMVHAGQPTTKVFTLVELPAAVGSLVGRITNSLTGADVALARVVAKKAGVERTATTNTSGRFLIERLPVGVYQLLISREGYHPKAVEGVEITEGDIVQSDQTLDPLPPTTGDLTGKVTGSDGAILAGAEVKLAQGAQVLKTTAANGQGVYRFEGLEPGEYIVRASFSGYRPAYAEGVIVAVGQTTTQDLLLQKETEVFGSIKGVVKDATTGAHLGDAGVELLTPFFRLRYTNDAGNYQFNDLPPGIYTMKCFKEGYQTEYRQDVVVVAGQATVENFHLRPVGGVTPGGGG